MALCFGTIVLMHTAGNLGSANSAWDNFPHLDANIEDEGIEEGNVVASA